MAGMDDFEGPQRQLAARIREGGKNVYNYQELLTTHFPAIVHSSSE